MVTNTTVTTELVEDGEKRDRLGRKITTGARREGVRYPTFATWVQQERAKGERSESNVKPKLHFAEMTMPGAASTLGIEVRLSDGTIVRGANAREVVSVVRALRR